MAHVPNHFYVCDGCKSHIGTRGETQPIIYHSPETGLFHDVLLAFCPSCARKSKKVRDVILKAFERLGALRG